jgi:hypothetical protein
MTRWLLERKGMHVLHQVCAVVHDSRQTTVAKKIVESLGFIPTVVILSQARPASSYSAQMTLTRS